MQYPQPLSWASSTQFCLRQSTLSLIGWGLTLSIDFSVARLSPGCSGALCGESFCYLLTTAHFVGTFVEASYMKYTTKISCTWVPPSPAASLSRDQVPSDLGSSLWEPMWLRLRKLFPWCSRNPEKECERCWSGTSGGCCLGCSEITGLLIFFICDGSEPGDNDTELIFYRWWVLKLFTWLSSH